MSLADGIHWHRLPAAIPATRAAALLGFSRWTISRLMDAGAVEAIRLHRNRRVKTASLRTWWESRSTADHLDDARLIGGPKNRRRTPCS